MRAPDGPDERRAAAEGDLPPRAPGQLRELRLRLERLPPGHPSAPEPEPPPAGELPPPAAELPRPGGEPGAEQEREAEAAEPDPGPGPDAADGRADVGGGRQEGGDGHEGGRDGAGRPRHEGESAWTGRAGPGLGAGLGPLGAGDPYRPWFTDGDLGQPWFAGEAD